MSSRSKWTMWMVVTALTLVAAGLPDAIAHAGATGSLAVVDPDAGKGAVTSGDQLTEFVVKLPDGSTCPGDTQHDGWQLVGFIIPADDDPTALVFTTLGPTERYIDGVTRRLALYRVERSPVGLANLPRNEVADKPGRIPAIPPLTFAQPATLGLAGGRYQIGIGCVHEGIDLGDYWTAIVDITRPAELTSTELTWTVVQAAPASAKSSDSSAMVPVIVGVACLLGVGYFVSASRRRNAASSRQQVRRARPRTNPSNAAPRKDIRS
ncbi:MAG: hypothetical protein WCK21_02620 [Actinomycetota bacterium]